MVRCRSNESTIGFSESLSFPLSMIFTFLPLLRGDFSTLLFTLPECLLSCFQTKVIDDRRQRSVDSHQFCQLWKRDSSIPLAILRLYGKSKSLECPFRTKFLFPCLDQDSSCVSQTNVHVHACSITSLCLGTGRLSRVESRLSRSMVGEKTENCHSKRSSRLGFCWI